MLDKHTCFSKQDNALDSNFGKKKLQVKYQIHFYKRNTMGKAHI